MHVKWASIGISYFFSRFDAIDTVNSLVPPPAPYVTDMNPGLYEAISSVAFSIDSYLSFCLGGKTSIEIVGLSELITSITFI